MHDVLIIRHGESEWNLEHRWQGWRDSCLTELGVSQAHDRAAALVKSGFAPVLVHSSDLGRARQTAEIIAAALDVALRLHPGFRERSGGDWEGYVADQIDERWPGMRDAWRRGEVSSPPGGEDDATVLRRFDAALTNVIGAGMPAMVVTHHGVLRLAATRVGVAIDTLIPNLGGYWFSADGAGLTNPEPIPPLASATELPAAE